jgi:hypothetical protein
MQPHDRTRQRVTCRGLVFSLKSVLEQIGTNYFVPERCVMTTMRREPEITVFIVSQHSNRVDHL